MGCEHESRSFLWKAVISELAFHRTAARARSTYLTGSSEQSDKNSLFGRWRHQRLKNRRENALSWSGFAQFTHRLPAHLLKIIAWTAGEGIVLETFPPERIGEVYEEATRGRSAPIEASRFELPQGPLCRPPRSWSTTARSLLACAAMNTEHAFHTESDLFTWLWSARCKS